MNTILTGLTAMIMEQFKKILFIEITISFTLQILKTDF